MMAAPYAVVYANPFVKRMVRNENFANSVHPIVAGGMWRALARFFDMRSRDTAALFGLTRVKTVLLNVLQLDTYEYSIGMLLGGRSLTARNTLFDNVAPSKSGLKYKSR